MAEEETVIRIAASLLVAAAVLMPGRPAPAEEVRIKHGGLTLNADLELAGGKTLADGVVLIVHGTLAHKDMEIVVALQDMLKDRALTSLAINLALGVDDRHGMFDCTAPHRHLDGDAMGEIAAWVAWLKGRGAGPVTLLGHSRSGNQVARYLIGIPDKAVKRAVLVAPGLGGADGYLEKGYLLSHKEPLAPVLARAEALVKAGKGDELLKGVGLIYCRDANVAAATFVDYYRFDPARDTTAIVTKIKVPVLVVAATADKINPRLIEKMKGKVGGKVSMVVIEDSGHFFRDLFGEDLADAIAEFIAKGPES